MKVGERYIWDRPGSKFIIEILSIPDDSSIGPECVCVQEIDVGSPWKLGEQKTSSLRYNKTWELLKGQETPQ